MDFISGCTVEAYDKLLHLMCTNVPIPCSDKYNAIYDQIDLHASLVNLSINRYYAESGMKLLSIGTERRLPSGSWVRNRISCMSEEQVKHMMGNAGAAMLQTLWKFGIFNAPITAAVDYHKIARYDKITDEKMVRSKYKDGTCKFECYATLQCVDKGRRAQISCKQVGCFDEKHLIIERLVTESRLNGIRIALLLLDRGFFAIDVIKMLKKLQVRFLMPCVMNGGIKKALQEYIGGKRKGISRYIM
jgi:putative transposase